MPSHPSSSTYLYEEVLIESVQSASGSCKLVGKGHVYLPLYGGRTYVEAYHAPQFQSNILSLGLLSEFFNINFMSEHSYNGDFPCYILRRRSKNIIYTSECEDGLFRLKLDNSRPVECHVLASRQTADLWELIMHPDVKFETMVSNEQIDESFRRHQLFLECHYGTT